MLKHVDAGLALPILNDRRNETAANADDVFVGHGKAEKENAIFLYLLQPDLTGLFIAFQLRKKSDSLNSDIQDKNQNIDIAPISSITFMCMNCHSSSKKTSHILLEKTRCWRRATSLCESGGSRAVSKWRLSRVPGTHATPP